MQSTLQWTCCSDTSKGLRTQLNVFDVIVRRDICILSERYSKALKEDLTTAGKSIPTSSANAFNVKMQIFFNFQFDGSTTVFYF